MGERESAATWFKQPSCVTVRGWVFRREKGAVMSYRGLNREQSSDAMGCPHILMCKLELFLARL